MGEKTKKRSNKKKTSKKSTRTKQKPKKIYVFDANFFICLKNIKVIRSLENLAQIKKELGLSYYISNTVFNELKFMHGSRSINFKEAVKVTKITGEELDEVKTDLEIANVKLLAQDPDLTLVALCKRIKKEITNSQIYLVSDDFKLSENVKVLNYGIEFLSLSAFLLFLSRKSKKPELKSYFKSTRDKALKYTLNYMLERRTTYNFQAKVMWLLEKAVSVADDGISIMGLEDSFSNKPKQKQKYDHSAKKLHGIDRESKRIQIICYKYLQNRKISSEELDIIVLMIPLLDDIKNDRKIIASAKNALKEDDYDDAVENLHNARNLLMNTIQKAGSILPYKMYMTFERVASSELSKCEFLRAFLLIGTDEITNAIEILSSSAMFSTIAKVTNSVLAINYLKALLHMFNEKYKKSIDQFKFTLDLATNYGENELLILKCLIGQAITQFMAGNQTQAVKLIDLINKDIQGDALDNALIILTELGDYFYAISKPKISIALYDEALECAVDSDNLEWKIDLIMEKLKKAYVSAMLDVNSSKEVSNIDNIIDRTHELKNVDRYSEEIGKLSKFNQMFYEKFPIFTGKEKRISYFELDSEMKDTFDVVDILRDSNTNRTVLICYNPNLGLIGFRVKLSFELQGFPEDYTISLTKKAKLKILKPSDKLKAKYLIRAIFQFDDSESIKIERNIPIFFSQMKI